MADRIKGITIEIGGDTTKLQTALKDVDKQLKTTQSTLKDVNKLLKLDPGNTELLTQKQKNLEAAIDGTKKRLEQLRAAQGDVAEGTPEWDNLQREIIATEQQLKGLENEYKNFGTVAAQKVAAVGQSMEKLGGKVESVGRALQPLSTAAAGALTAIGGIAYKSVSAADELNTLSNQTGISTDELQKMQYAADLVDVSVEDITGALRKMKPKMQEGNKTFEKLGVSVTNADGSLRSATDVFYDSIAALSQISNETERDQIAMELFGRGADSLAGIIDDGGAALKAYGQEAEELGLILSQDTIDSLNSVNDTVDKTKARVGASLAQFGATAATALAPVLDKVVGVIDKVTEKLRNLTPEQTETIMKTLGIVAAIAPVLIAGGKLIKGVGTALTLAPKIVSGVKLVAGFLNPGTLGITLVVAAVAGLALVIYKNWDKIKEWTTNLVASIKEKWETLKINVTTTVNNIKAAVTTTWENVRSTVSMTVENIRAGVTNAWANIRNGVVNAVSGLRSSVVSIWDSMRASVNSVIDSIRGKIDTFKNKFNELKSTVSNVVSNIKNAFNFSWSLPKIKLPHFRVNGGKWPYGLGGEGYLPSISVSWYKKAYDNPVLFKSPTVLQTPTGYKGFGDGHGAEIVMGLNKLRELIGTSSDTTINVYAAPGMNVNELADAVQQRLVALNRQREAAYA